MNAVVDDSLTFLYAVRFPDGEVRYGALDDLGHRLPHLFATRAEARAFGQEYRFSPRQLTVPEVHDDHQVCVSDGTGALVATATRRYLTSAFTEELTEPAPEWARKLRS